MLAIRSGCRFGNLLSDLFIRVSRSLVSDHLMHEIMMARISVYKAHMTFHSRPRLTFPQLYYTHCPCHLEANPHTMIYHLQYHLSLIKYPLHQRQTAAKTISPQGPGEKAVKCFSHIARIVSHYILNFVLKGILCQSLCCNL